METLEILKRAKLAAPAMSVLTTAQKNKALRVFAKLLEKYSGELIAENRKDLSEQQGKLEASLFDRLHLDAGKLGSLKRGALDLVRLEDPVGKILARTELDKGLVLDKVSVPLGVLAIVFESRPDVIPQILMLALKSSNCVVLKGGSEAENSNQSFMSLVQKLEEECPFLPAGWAQLIHGREAFQSLLGYTDYIDLVIPRGSNSLVRAIQGATKIPVLGHADGVCHIFVHRSAELDPSLEIILDSKVQYPSACNALETLLLDGPIASKLLPKLRARAVELKLNLKGCQMTRQLLPEIGPVENWSTEYGNLTLAIRVVQNMNEAISHIQTYGSHHTDAILAGDKQVQELFLSVVDSANVFANCSTRFADGFRYGLGAEVGISTAKTHARGPVGLEGLVIYKYLLRGKGQRVAPYCSDKPKKFTHRRMKVSHAKK